MKHSEVLRVLMLKMRGQQAWSLPGPADIVASLEFNKLSERSVLGYL